MRGRGVGAQSGRPPRTRATLAGKTQPKVAPLSTVHDMARAATGRDDVERAWRRTFRGVHEIGYKAGGEPGRKALQQMGREPTTPARSSASGARKRRHRGHSQSALFRAVTLGLERRMVEAMGQPETLRLQGWEEVRPGQWRLTDAERRARADGTSPWVMRP
jgi:hypothetical protein